MSTWTYTIRKNEYNEFVVRFYINGKHYPAADYFTDCRQDAKQTAESEVSRLNNKG